MKPSVLKGDLLPLVIAAGAGPFLIFFRGAWFWSVLAVPAIWMARGLLGFKWIRNTPIHAAVGLLVLWIFLGILRTPEIENSSAKLAGLAYGVVIFFILVDVLKTARRVKMVLLAFLAAGALVAIVGILNPAVYSLPKNEENRSLIRTIKRVPLRLERAEAGINPNPVGGTLMLFVPLGFGIVSFLLKKQNGFLASCWKIPVVVAIFAILTVIVSAVYLTESFGAWLGFGIVMLMMGHRGRVLKGFVGIAAFAVLLLFVLKSGPESLTGGSTLRGRVIASMNNRIPMWGGGLAAIRENPVFGIGMDRLRLKTPFVYEFAHAHNQFIHTAAEVGLPPLIAYLAILIGAGWMTIEVARSRMPPWMIQSMRGLAWGQVGFAIFGIADAIALGAKPGIFFWISLAIMTSIYLYGRDHGLLERA